MLPLGRYLGDTGAGDFTGEQGDQEVLGFLEWIPPELLALLCNPQRFNSPMSH
jgi:hypothetical protein